MSNKLKNKPNQQKTAYAKSRVIRSSPRKLNLVADFIRNQKASEALVQLKFLNKKAAVDVKKCLQSAIANAEHNYGFDIDNLYITEVLVGKSILMKRIRPRAKGKASRINKFFSNLTIKVTEIEE